MLNQLASLVRVDFSPRHRQPSALRVLLATIASIAGSLAADALLVVIGEAVFPSTKGFVHFQFSDYAKLTVVGVIIACLAWPVVTRISSAPRWLFFRLAILVTLVLWLPGPVDPAQGRVGQGGGGAHGHAPGHRRGHLQPAGAPRPGTPLLRTTRGRRGSAGGGRAAGRPPARGAAASRAGGHRLAAEQPSRGQHRHAR